MYFQTISPQEERKLILLLNNGDEAAFEKLYNLYSIRILQKLLLILKDEETARELLQDIFLTIWEKRLNIDAEKSLRCYLFRIAENRIVDVFRRAARDRKLRERLVNASVSLCYQTEDAVTFKESNTLLHQAINNLPPQRKKIFVLCRMEGKTYEEAGKIVGVSPGTINDHMVKAVRTLKASFAAADLVIFCFMAVLARFPGFCW